VAAGLLLPLGVTRLMCRYFISLDQAVF